MYTKRKKRIQYSSRVGARGDAVGWGTALQPGRWCHWNFLLT